MVIAVRRKNHTVGKSSRFLNIPYPVENGEESTIVVGGRLLIADPRGIIPEGDLKDFFENCVEPAFWAWMRKHSVQGPGEEKAIPGADS